MKYSFERSDFPPDFVFGAATSAYQIEGHKYGGAGKTHWDSFAEQPGRVVNAENGSIACDHYHLFEQDLDLMRGFDAYRFSTSWARVLPDGRGQINEQGLDFYDRLVDAILARDLHPFLTLYHWELPAALDQAGGWRNPDIARWFRDYADIVMNRLGDRVHSTATTNEPWCISYLSHFLGHHAPGLRDAKATAQSIHNVLRAHGKTMTMLREGDYANLGIVLNFEAIQPQSPSEQDVQAAARHDATMNKLFAQPLFKGTYPAKVLDGLGQYLPDNWQEDMAEISQPLDWLGVNYYTRATVADDPGTDWPTLKRCKTDAPKTQLDWDIYPQGLGETLGWLTDEYTGELPIYVTENGMAWADSVSENAVVDRERIDYINSHVNQIQQAISAGQNIKGFFYWSLLDNFEWAFGYDMRFGLVHVDFSTLKRTPKQSYHLLINAIKRE